jgi:hypothetical protein
VTVHRGRIEEFDPGTWRAAVRLTGSGPQYLAGVRVSHAVGVGALVAGARCVVDVGEAGDPDDALVVAADVPGAPGLGCVDRSSAVVDVVNTAAETSIYSYTLPAGWLGGEDWALRLTMAGDYLNNSGGSRILTLRVKLGGTTLYADATAANVASSTRRAWRLELGLTRRAGTDGQQLLYGLVGFSSSAAADTGIGDIGAAAVLAHPIVGEAAESLASAKVFQVTLQHPAAHASLSWRRRWAMLERVA